MDRDDLSYLPPELAGRIRADVLRYHELFDRHPWDDVESPGAELSAIMRLGLDVVALLQVHAHEIRRLRRATQAVRFQAAVSSTVLALAALALAAACLLRV